MRSKTILMVLFIFLMGLLTGWMSSRMVARHFFEKEARKPLKERVENHVMRTVKPSPEQEKRIKVVLDEFIETHQEMRRRHRQEMMQSMKRLPQLLEPELEPKQFEELKTEMEKLKRFRKGKRKGGPPPHLVPPPPPPPPMEE